MSRRGDSDLKEMEGKAGELVALTMEVCERRLASARAPLTPPQIALSAAAMTVHHSVETFLAVTKIPDQPAEK
jgi:cytochrome c oxidase subunit IV